MQRTGGAREASAEVGDEGRFRGVTDERLASESYMNVFYSQEENDQLESDTWGGKVEGGGEGDLLNTDFARSLPGSQDPPSGPTSLPCLSPSPPSSTRSPSTYSALKKRRQGRRRLASMVRRRLEADSKGGKSVTGGSELVGAGARSPAATREKEAAEHGETSRVP